MLRPIESFGASSRLHRVSLAALLLAGVLQLACSDESSATPGADAGASAPDSDLAIVVGRLIQPADGTVLEDAVILIDQGRFRYVGTDRAQIGPATEVLDWGAYVAMPGLVDAHTHVAFATDDVRGTTPWERLSQLTRDEVLALARDNALRAVRTGVTTMIDKGAPQLIDLDLRDEIASGATRGPRLFVAGAGLSYPFVSTAESIEHQIDQQAADGTDLVKLWADGCSDSTVECTATITPALVQAAIDSAHAHGKSISIHAYHADVARPAIEAGTDSLEHAEGLDASMMQLMVDKGSTYVPTIDHNRYYAENAEWFGYDATVPPALDAYLQKNLETAKEAVAAGVTFAMGSDAVFTMFGENTRELRWLVEAGMTPMEALRAATHNGARSIGKQAELGAVQPGYIADIIAVEGDPLADVEAVIGGVRAVVKDGKLVDLD